MKNGKFEKSIIPTWLNRCYLFWGMGLAFVLLVSYMSCTPKTKPTQTKSYPEIAADWLSYEEVEYTIRYPKDWIMRKDIDPADFCLVSPQLAPDHPFQENVSLVSETLPKAISLDQYAAAAIKRISSLYNVVSENKYVCNGQAYYQAILKGDDDFLLEQHYYVKNRKAYIITFIYRVEGLGHAKATGVKIMNSFILK